jgi:hypothetical protein
MSAKRSVKGALVKAAAVTSVLDGHAKLAPAQQRVLDALLWFEHVGITAPQRPALAPIAGSKHTSGGFKNNLGALRSAGLIDYPQPNAVSLTGAGREVANPPEIDTNNEALQQAFANVMPPAQQRILWELVGVYPNSLSREDLAAAVGVPHTSGGFKNNLGAMRTLGAIDYPSPGEVAATDLLFPEGA